MAIIIDFEKLCSRYRYPVIDMHCTIDADTWSHEITEINSASYRFNYWIEIIYPDALPSGTCRRQWQCHESISILYQYNEIDSTTGREY